MPTRTPYTTQNSSSYGKFKYPHIQRNGTSTPIFLSPQKQYGFYWRRGKLILHGGDAEVFYTDPHGAPGPEDPEYVSLNQFQTESQRYGSQNLEETRKDRFPEYVEPQHQHHTYFNPLTGYQRDQLPPIYNRQLSRTCTPNSRNLPPGGQHTNAYMTQASTPPHSRRVLSRSTSNLPSNQCSPPVEMTSRATSPIFQGSQPQNLSAPTTPASTVFQHPCSPGQYPRPQTQIPRGRLPNHNFSNERMHTLKYGQKFENFDQWQTENRKYGNDRTPLIIE